MGGAFHPLCRGEEDLPQGRLSGPPKGFEHVLDAGLLPPGGLLPGLTKVLSTYAKMIHVATPRISLRAKGQPKGLPGGAPLHQAADEAVADH